MEDKIKHKGTLLNRQQQEAVSSIDGYVRVIAGAGSGKTRTLVERYVYLVKEAGVSTSNILCITFTNKAANEMKNRIAKIIGSQHVIDYICTYHGFGVKVLREDIGKLSYPSTFIIMDQEDQKALLSEVYDEMNLTTKNARFSDILKKIHYWKSQFSYIQDYIDVYDAEQKSAFAHSDPQLAWQVFVRYLQKQQKGFYLDFEDLICFTIYILEKYPEVALKWQQRLDYIMVDETQDNSNLQWRLLTILQQRHHNLFIVGDPDQSIYGWRGASPNLLIDFDKTFGKCKTIVLNQNYRSTPNILAAANSVITNNMLRIPKDLFTTKDASINVCHYHAKTEEVESDFIALTILDHVKNGGKMSDCAVLYRASFISRYIEQGLMRRQIPYIVYGGIRFFEREEIKDSLAYLRMIDKADDLSFKRVVNKPRRKLGKAFLEELQKTAEKEGETLYNTLRKNIESPPFNKAGAAAFVNVIESAKGRLNDLSISDILYLLLESSGLYDLYRLGGDEAKMENLQELIDSIKFYEANNANEEELTVTTYLQDIALYTNLDVGKSGDSVKIMTVHQAKGLEFPIVFIAGLSEGVFPNLRTMQEHKKDGLEEERRLAYVAITRAENRLYLTESEGYNYTLQRNKMPSRFIFEIKSTLLDRMGEWSDDFESTALSYIEDIDNQVLSEDEDDDDDLTEGFEVGDAVSHKLFGNGTIVDIDLPNSIATINFAKYSEPKHLQLSSISLLIN